MKIKKLLPILMVAAMFTPAAFAGDTPTAKADHADQLLQLTVSDFINIWVKNSHDAETIAPSFNYDSFTIPSALTVDYGVITNKHGDKIYLKATTGTTNLTALKATDKDHLRIAFTNYSATTGAPDQTAVTSALTKDSDKTKNPNVIALDITPTITNALGATAAQPTADVSTDGVVAYTLEAGTYDFLYTSATSEASSLSSLDETGLYKATLTLTHTATP